MLKYPIHLISILNPDELTPAHVDRVLKVAQKLLRTIDVNLRVDIQQHNFELQPEPYAEPFQMSGAYRSAFMKCWPYEVEHHNVHLLIPPVIVGRYKFFGGVGGCVCCDAGNRVSASSAFLSDLITSPSSKLPNKLYSCGAVMAHEIGHVIGLGHRPLNSQAPDADTTPPNIMHPVMNMYSGHRHLGFLPGSRKLVKECLTSGF